MIPRKTELALTTLQSHRSPLTLLQRRALILADGQRDLATLAMLLGGDGTALLHSLCAMGYLDLGTAAGGAAGQARSTAATAALPDVDQAGMPRPDAGPTDEELQRLRRRAATNARLYLLDILQLQRNALAAALHRQLHAARDEDQISTTIAEALQALPQITSASYAERVRTRIGCCRRHCKPRDLAVLASARRLALAESLNTQRGLELIAASPQRQQPAHRQHRSQSQRRRADSAAAAPRLRSGLSAADTLLFGRQAQAAGTRDRYLAAIHAMHSVPEQRPHQLTIAYEILVAR